MHPPSIFGQKVDLNIFKLHNTVVFISKYLLLDKMSKCLNILLDLQLRTEFYKHIMDMSVVGKLGCYTTIKY